MQFGLYFVSVYPFECNKTIRKLKFPLITVNEEALKTINGVVSNENPD